MTELALTILIVVGVAAIPAFADDAGDRRRDRGETWPVAADVRVEIEIVSGRIEIRGWDRDEIRVKAKGRGAESLRVEVEEGGGEASIKLSHRGFGLLHWTGNRLDVDLVIDLPKDSDITARSINGEILADDLTGIVNLNAANGEIEVNGPVSEARLETLNAGIELNGKNSRVEATTINGKIVLKGVAEEVRASTLNGSIEVRGGEVHLVELESLSGDIELEVSLDRHARVRGKSMSGDLKLELPEDTSAEFSVRSFSGDIENEFAKHGAPQRHLTGGREQFFETGEGRGRVRLETFSGDVEIKSSGK